MNRCSVATSSCRRERRGPGLVAREQPEIVEQLLEKILGRKQRIADDRDERSRLEVLNENTAQHRLARADFAGDNGERLASSQGEGDLLKSRRVRLALKKKARVWSKAERRFDEPEVPFVPRDTPNGSAAFNRETSLDARA